MNHFTISDIENLTDIKAHTLRIWEQRYGLFTPKRKDSQHRFYDGEDLKKLLRIAWLYHQGHKISHIANMSEKEIMELALATSGQSNDIEVYLNRLMEASIDLDVVLFNELMDTVITKYGMDETMTKLVFPLLKKIGLLWLTGHIIPSQEHFASGIIIQKMAKAINDLPVVPYKEGAKKIVVYSPEGEYHEIPLLYMQYLLKKNAVPSMYCGSSVSIELLKELLFQQPITGIYFQQITKINRLNMEDYFKNLSDSFPDKEIAFSGACMKSATNLPANFEYLPNEEAIRNYISRQIIS